MNDLSQPRSPSNTGTVLMGFALGAVVGAGLALLLAPDSGKRTRERLGSTARNLGRRVGGAIDHARETATELGTDARSAIKAGQDAFLHDRSMRDSRSSRRMSRAEDSPVDADVVKSTGD